MEATLRTTLVKLNHMLNSDDVSSMKFMCKDLIPSRKRSELKTSLDLFDELEQRGKLENNDISFIEYLLTHACSGRTDVLDVIDEFKTSSQSQKNIADDDARDRFEFGPGQSQQLCNSRDLSAVSTFLQDHLGREYLMVLRRLGVDDNDLDRLEGENPCNMKEVIHKALKLWHSTNCNGSCILKVVEALKGEKRNDLAKKMEIKYIV